MAAVAAWSEPVRTGLRSETGSTERRGDHGTHRASTLSLPGLFRRDSCDVVRLCDLTFSSSRGARDGEADRNRWPLGCGAAWRSPASLQVAGEEPSIATRQPAQLAERGRTGSGGKRGLGDLEVELAGSAVERLPGEAERLHGAVVPACSEVPACSIGIMAFNEAANIAAAIRTLLAQPVTSVCLAEVIVVASGCTDGTPEIVAELAQSESRVRLVTQDRRQGKASAVNLFIAQAKSPLLLMVSADVLVEEGTLDALLGHFADSEVGMVGGHPIPVNDETRFLGHAIHLLWRLHDRLAREAPKLGEIVAFRNVVPSIPLDSAVDEISLQALITQLGYRTIYEPQAIVYNRGPATVADLLRQRRRIYAGHLQVRRQQGYAASTMSVRRIIRALKGSGSFRSLRTTMWTLGAIGLEALARGLGHIDRLRHRDHAVWRPVITTKAHIVEGANGQGPTSVIVFHIVNFHRHQLEAGIHAARLLTQRVLRHVQEALGNRATVSAQKSGTIIALLFVEREEAERVAGEIVERVNGAEKQPVLSGDTPMLRIACGIIAFPQGGQAVASAVVPGLSLPGGQESRQWSADGLLSEAGLAPAMLAPVGQEGQSGWA
jgi:biofilm PGA synthesis N-glycosyltransferase PgaC